MFHQEQGFFVWILLGVPSNWDKDAPFLQVWVSLVAQMVKNLLAMQEIQVPSLVGEDPLEKRMATHSSILAWRTQWTEEPGRLWSIGSQRVRHAGSDLHKVLLLISFK